MSNRASPPKHPDARSAHLPNHNSPTTSPAANEGQTPSAAMQAFAMLETLPEALLLLDQHGVVQAANAAAEPLLMQGRKRMLGQPLSRWMQDAESLPHHLRQCWLTQLPQKERALTVLPRHQPPLPVLMELWPVMDARGEEACGLLARLRVAPAAQPAAAPAQDSAAYMAAVLAHEIKNPLAGIRAAAQLVAPHLPPSTAAMGGLILREVDRIRALVEQMEVFNQPQAQKPEAVNIHEVLRHASLLLTTSDESNGLLAITEQFDPSLPHAAAHPDALTQIVLNLMKNAVEAMRGCETQQLQLTTDYYRETAGSSYVRLRVADTGTGIPEALQPSIFEPFVTHANGNGMAGGKGLGLAICAKLSNDMGGRLQLAESRPGFTCFELLLPIWR